MRKKLIPWKEVRGERHSLPSPPLTILISSPKLDNATLLNDSVYNAVLTLAQCYTADVWNSFILHNWNQIAFEQQFTMSFSLQSLMINIVCFYEPDYTRHLLWLDLASVLLLADVSFSIMSSRFIHVVIYGMIFFFVVAELCWVMSDSLQPMDCSPPRSSVHGIFQARILK